MNHHGTRPRVQMRHLGWGRGGRIPPAVTGATFVTGRVETMHFL